VLDELAATLDDIAAAILARDRKLAEAALVRARGIDDQIETLADAVTTGRETIVYAPARRRSRGRVEDYAEAAVRIDLAVRNVRVLARGTIRAIRLDDNVPPQVAEAIGYLAEAVRGFVEVFEHPERVAAVHEPALRAAATASHVLESTGNMSVSVIVGQVRSTATDLLAGTGMGSDEAADQVSRISA
jgi:hypothetical protein